MPLMQKLKVWLDDNRDPLDQSIWHEFPMLKDGGWTWINNIEDAGTLILAGCVEYISFDNDLGLPQEGRHLAAQRIEHRH